MIACVLNGRLHFFGLLHILLLIIRNFLILLSENIGVPTFHDVAGVKIFVFEYSNYDTSINLDNAPFYGKFPSNKNAMNVTGTFVKIKKSNLK